MCEEGQEEGLCDLVKVGECEPTLEQIHAYHEGRVHAYARILPGRDYEQKVGVRIEKSGTGRGRDQGEFHRSPGKPHFT